MARSLCAGFLSFLLGTSVAAAQSETGGGAPGENSAGLAKQLANPIAALISVPFQSNYDWGTGQFGNGRQYKLNIQPVIPISLNENWNLISRTILPLIDQDSVVVGEHQTGFGDTVQSLFFSPKAPTSRGWIWGAGPVFLLPTATDKALGSQKWGAGPTVVVLKQQGPWTIGALVNHLWSFAGHSDRSPVSTTFVQPFAAYTTKSATTFTLNTESTYDWTRKQWTVPVNVTVAQLFSPKLTGLPMPIQVQLGYRYYLDAPRNKPNGGVRLSLTALFPIK